MYSVVQSCLSLLQPHGLWSARLLCPWNFLGKNTGVGCHALLQGIFLTQGSNTHFFVPPALVGGFFTNSATWEAVLSSVKEICQVPSAYPVPCLSASLVAQLIKNPPAMQETWVRSLGWEDPLEKEKATHTSILAWRIPWTV